MSILGRPNVGKSTLLNALLGEKIAIVSSKPQTTRTRITGVLTKDGTQFVFLDTPGFLHARTKLDTHMLKAINSSIADMDVAIFVVDPKSDEGPAELELLKKLSAAALPVILAINKIDAIQDKQSLIKVIAAWQARFDFKAVVPVSAKNGDGTDILLDEIAKALPEGPQYFPEDTLTDQPERVIVAEIIREKLLRLLSEEVPHGTAVTVERMKEQPKITEIEATIYCEKESHKGIIIGHGGQMLKRIGTYARADIEKFLGCHVNLKLWVKVRDDWRNHETAIKTMGYD